MCKLCLEKHTKWNPGAIKALKIMRVIQQQFMSAWKYCFCLLPEIFLETLNDTTVDFVLKFLFTRFMTLTLLEISTWNLDSAIDPLQLIMSQQVYIFFLSHNISNVFNMFLTLSSEKGQWPKCFEIKEISTWKTFQWS